MLSHCKFAIIPSLEMSKPISDMVEIIKTNPEEALLHPKDKTTDLTNPDHLFYNLLSIYHLNPVSKSDKDCFIYICEKILPLILSTRELIEPTIQSKIIFTKERYLLALLKILLGFCGDFYNLTTDDFLKSETCGKFPINNTLREFLKNCRTIHNKSFHEIPDVSDSMVVATYELAYHYSKLITPSIASNKNTLFIADSVQTEQKVNRETETSGLSALRNPQA